MEIFYNSSTSGYEEIAGSGPKWWTEYREMDAVYMFEGWLLDIMAKKMEQEVKNIFPSQADYPSLVEYEKMLCIDQDEDITIEERRRIVQAYYSGAGHLSRSAILQMAKAYTGFDANVFWKNGNLYIEFDNAESVFSSLESLQKAIERRMPAHLVYVYRVRRAVKSNIGYSILSKEYKKITITEHPTFDPIVNVTWIVDEMQTTLIDENGNILNI